MSNANTLKFAELEKRAIELGEQAGKGADTQIKFLLSMVEGGYHSALDLDANKHGTGIDDATKLAEVYVKARTGATTFDAKAGNQRKLISTCRTGIKLGMWPKGGGGEPLGTVNNLMTHRQKLRKDPANAKKLDDAANTLLRFARAQLKRELLIEPAEFDSFCFRADPQQRTLAQEWEGIRKSMLNLAKGKSTGVIDGNAKVQKVIELCTDRLKEIAIEQREEYSKRRTPAKHVSQ